MTKRVLDVGNCQPDFAAISGTLKRLFGAATVQAHDMDGALAALREGGFDLVLVNRKLDRDYSDGLAIINRIKSDDGLQHVPVMMVTNYAEHQQTAVQAGAEPGFGKLELNKPATREKLARFLG